MSSTPPSMVMDVTNNNSAFASGFVPPGPPFTPTLQPNPSHQQSTPNQDHFSPVTYPSNDFLSSTDDFLTSETNHFDYQFPGWTADYGLVGPGPGVFQPPISIRQDTTITAFCDYSQASNSESMAISQASPCGSNHTRGTSTMSAAEFEPNKLTDMTMCIPKGAAVPEFEVVVTAENSWPLARCNRPKFSADCPRTAIVHLEALEQKCKQDSTWDGLDEYLRQCGPKQSLHSAVVPITSRTRDRMTAITQTFLQKALGVHRGGTNGYGGAGYPSPGNAFPFIMLPPNTVLEYLLGSYARNMGDYYPLAHGLRVDPNAMLQNNQASTLLILLMIAQGAAAVPMEEARHLSAGLTETSRISLFDLIEKDVELSADPIVLRCALLFTHIGTWSGDKWQMDIAMGQRGMYLSVS